MRCVEAWSMVIPWVGFPLAALLDRVEPLGSAKLSPSRPWSGRRKCRASPAISSPWMALPEGLRLDEARHPLTILSVGLYGKTLPKPERRTYPPGGTVEIRLQGNQIDRAHLSDRDAAAVHLEPRRAE